MPTLALLVGALYGVRRLRRRADGASEPVTVSGRAGLTRGALVAVVETDGRRFLVGAGEQGVRLLSELDARPGPAVPATGSHPTALPDDLHVDMDEAPARPTWPSDQPWSGLVHRLQQATVRTHVEAPLRDVD